MKSTLMLAATTALALTTANAAAQMWGGGWNPPAHTITTSTDYGAIANLGGSTDFDAVANGTAVTRPLWVGARSGRWFGDTAAASSLVSFARSFRSGDGVSVHEHGLVRNTDPNRGASAGTSNDAPGAMSPTQDAHGVQVNYPNIAMGTNAIVTIQWYGNATMGASATADIDVDGDGMPDFSGVADGNRATAVLQVAAGANGVTIDITTDGSAAVAADGQEHYGAWLSVYVKEGTLPTSCTFSNFGMPCGADLNGSVGANLDLTLDVTNAVADAFGYLAVGDRAASPSPLPIGSCNLLLENRRWFGGRLFRTDGGGAATLTYPTPRMTGTIAFQALVFSYDRPTSTRNLDASNGTELVCQ